MSLVKLAGNSSGLAVLILLMVSCAGEATQPTLLRRPRSRQRPCRRLLPLQPRYQLHHRRPSMLRP